MISASESVRPTGKVSTRTLKQLLEWQGYLCALSGVKLSPDTVGLDHIVPVRDGGSDSTDNVQLVHTSVNAMKGTMPNSEFVEWCRRVVESTRPPSQGPSS